MANRHWTYKVSLRFFSEFLSVDELAAALGVQADEAHRKGEPHTLRNGMVWHRQNSVLYLYSCLPEDRPLDEHLATILKRAEEVAEAVQALGDQVTMDVNCKLSSGGNWMGLCLSPAMMKSLSDHGLHLGLFFELPPQTSDACEGRETDADH